MRPDFGCGVMNLIFAPESDALVSATQFLVQGSLQRWLGDVIVVNAVVVQAVESTFSITVQTATLANGMLGYLFSNPSLTGVRTALPLTTRQQQG